MELLGEETRPVAQKDYDCDASPWIYNGDMNRDCYEYHELRDIVRAKRDGYMIKKGMRYIKQTLKDRGDIYTFRARLDMHDLCLKYDIYEDA